MVEGEGGKPDLVGGKQSLEWATAPSALSPVNPLQSYPPPLPPCPLPLPPCPPPLPPCPPPLPPLSSTALSPPHVPPVPAWSRFGRRPSSRSPISVVIIPQRHPVFTASKNLLTLLREPGLRTSHLANQMEGRERGRTEKRGEREREKENKGKNREGTVWAAKVTFPRPLGR